MTRRALAALLPALLATASLGGCRTPAPFRVADLSGGDPPGAGPPGAAGLAPASPPPPAAADCRAFQPQVGITVTRRDAAGAAVAGRLRVLADNPGADVWVIGAWNRWGATKTAADRLAAVPGTPYLEGPLALRHGLEYRLLVGGAAVVDPAAGAFTAAGGAAAPALNSVYWDRDRPGAFKATAPSVDLSGKPLIIAEAELFALARKWPYRGAAGPARLVDTYRFVAESGLARELRAAGYDAVELLPVNASLDGDGWRDRYQVYGLFAPDGRYGTPDDFARMTDAFNLAHVAVILDAVVGRFPARGNAGARQLADVGLTHWRKVGGEALFGDQAGPDGTVAYDIANPHVRRFLADGVLSMVCRFGLSGVRLRGDRDGADAAWLEALAAEVRAVRPGAPVISAAPAAGLYGFINDNLGRPALQVDMERLHLALAAAVADPGLSYAGSYNEAAARGAAGGDYLATRLSGGDWYYVEKKTMAFASVALLSGAAFLDMPQQRLLQLGSLDDSPAVDWALRSQASAANVYAYFAALSTLVRERPAFAAAPLPGAARVDEGGGRRIVALARRAKGKAVLAVVNLSHVGQANYRFEVAAPGTYRVLLNSDAEAFGGSGELEKRLASGVTITDDPAAGGQAATLALPFLAPYATVLLEQQ